MRPPCASTISLQIGRPRPEQRGVSDRRVAGLTELLEHALLVLGRDADPGVLHADDDLAGPSSVVGASSGT